MVYLLKVSLYFFILGLLFLLTFTRLVLLTCNSGYILSIIGSEWYYIASNENNGESEIYDTYIKRKKIIIVQSQMKEVKALSI